jgi:hypothetical protein
MPGLRAGEYNKHVYIYGNHLECHRTLSRSDEIALGFEVSAADSGRELGESPAGATEIERTNAESWAEF